MIRDFVVANGTLWVAFLKHCLVLLVGRPELSDGGLCIKAKVRQLSLVHGFFSSPVGDIPFKTQIHSLIYVIFKTYQIPKDLWECFQILSKTQKYINRNQTSWQFPKHILTPN